MIRLRAMPFDSARRRVSTIASHLAASAQEAKQAGKLIESDDVNELYNTHNHSFLTELHEIHGDAFTLMRDGQPVTFVRNPDSIKQVTITMMEEGSHRYETHDDRHATYHMTMSLRMMMLYQRPTGCFPFCN